MNNRRAEEVLRFTFDHLEKVLSGTVEDRDGFIGRTAMLAENEYSRFHRDRAAEESRAETEK